MSAAGSATEAVTSGTANIAEDSIRVVEGIFKALAEHTLQKSHHPLSPEIEGQEVDGGDDLLPPSSFYEFFQTNTAAPAQTLSTTLRLFFEKTITASMDDVAGVKSVTVELFAAIVVSFIIGEILRMRATRR